MTGQHLNKQYLLSTLVAVTKVNPVTFNSWRKRNGLFPWTETEKGWKLYSLADICVAYAVNGLIKAGCVTQFAVDAATTLLPRFEAIIADPGGEAFKNPVALVTVIHHEVDDKNQDTEIYIEYHPPDVSLRRSVCGRLGWGTAVILDMLTVYGDVIGEINALQPEIFLGKGASLAVYTPVPVINISEDQE